MGRERRECYRSWPRVLHVVRPALSVGFTVMHCSCLLRLCNIISYLRRSLVVLSI